MKKIEETEELEMEHDEEDESSEEEEFERRCFKCPCLRNIFRKYNKRTLIVIGLAFFNEGAEFMTLLACTYNFLVENHKEPAFATIHTAIVARPVAFSCFFGLLSDTLDIAGFRKRLYICVAALLQIAVSLTLVLHETRLY